MMTPIIFYTLILGDRRGAPVLPRPAGHQQRHRRAGRHDRFFNLYLYKTFFTYQNMAYGATLAWLLFIVTLVVTLVLFRTSRRWVYYAGER